MTLTIGWGDCDPANIVFYPNYFVWFNEATTNHFALAGLTKKELIERFDVIGYPMVETSAKFLAPSSHGDEITIETSFVRLGGVSFNAEHSLYRDGTLCAKGFEKRILARQDTHGAITPIPIPDEIRELF